MLLRAIRNKMRKCRHFLRDESKCAPMARIHNRILCLRSFHVYLQILHSQ